ncbi:hypothetical protein PR003_g4049 [Phytophthora rubi]|uniref:Uncharacterized protein n=1 Tax=Phytophthora rubi TaxID=129364 RepID=A0A6A3NIH9_9STRA|nr:hypothetical protein PR002_g5091 [Phytophthora rubi]KAE9045278.1 hypothetical protein PR001_g5044 [Phytophthora rubi]KAE9353083.1 hypothetical protein PR003_g4049 [Phytophthora rubi]
MLLCISYIIYYAPCSACTTSTTSCTLSSSIATVRCPSPPLPAHDALPANTL